MLSANNLAFEDNPSDKLLIYIKNNNGPSMNPWRTPTLISDQSETLLQPIQGQGTDPSLAKKLPNYQPMR